MASPESELYLERFAVPWVPRAKQARELNLLVAGEPWLQTIFRGTAKRYETRKSARRSVARISEHKGIEAFVIRKGKIAFGIGTIITDQTLYHPTEGGIRGDDLDYWLGRHGLNDAKMHEQTVQKLVLEAIAAGSDAPNLMATAQPKQLAVQPLGFPSILQPVGEPARLGTDLRNDPWGLTKDGAVLQLFARSKESF